MNTLTAEEAIKALNEGRKIAHITFFDDEYICLKDGQITDELGYTHKEFWELRTHPSWDTGWTIVKERRMAPTQENIHGFKNKIE